MLKPATQQQLTDAQVMVAQLRNARFYARRAGCTQTLKKLQSAIKSAEGAVRHMQRRAEFGTGE